MIRRLALACILVVCGLSLSCKTGSSTQKEADDAPTEEAEAPAPDEGLALAFADQPGVVLKFQADAFDQVAPALDHLAARASGREADLLEGLADGDVFTLMAPILGRPIETPESFDATRPAYVSFAAVGGDRFGEAFLSGAALQPTAALPAAVRMRLVVPATDAAALEQALAQTAQPARQRGRTLVVSVQDDWVVADYLALRPGLDDLPGDASEPASPRQTPAYTSFAASRGPVSLYLNSRQAMIYGAARNQFDMARALETMTPEFRQRMLAAGTAANLNLTILSPPSEREFEDTYLGLGGDGEAFASLEGHSTLTDLGRSLAKANESAHDLPGPRAADAESIGLATANLALVEMAEAAPVESEMGAGDPQRLMRQFPNMLRESGWVGYAALLFGSPTLLVRAILPSLPESLRARLPKAAFGQVFMPDEAQMPSFAGTLLFGADQLDDQQIEEVQARLKNAEFPGGTEQFQSDRVDVDGGTALRFGVRSELTDEPASTGVPAGSIRVALDIVSLLRAMGQPDEAEAWTSFADLDASFRYLKATAQWSVHLGEPTGALKSLKKTPAMDAEPVSVAPGCVGEVLQARLEVFRAMAGVGADSSPETYKKMLAPFDSASEACGEANPEYADSLQLGRARFGEFIARRGQMTGNPEIVEAMRKRGCELGDQAQCEMLE